MPSKYRPKDRLDSDLFNVFIEVASELCWAMDIITEKIVWFASKANQQKFNFTPHSNSQQFWLDNIFPADREKTSQTFYANLDNPSVDGYTREYRFRAANGRWLYIRDKIKFIRGSNGKATRAIGVWEDVTTAIKKEKKAKQLLYDLEKDKNRFKIISELSNAVMWEEDLKTGRLYWTADTKTLEDFGLTDKEFNITDWKHHIHPEDCELSAIRFNGALKSTAGIYNDEYRVIKSDGSIAYILDRGVIIRDENNLPIRAIGGWVDVTKERVQEQSLLKTLMGHEFLNRRLANREEELALSEEELRQLNIELSHNNKVLTERDQVISKLQHLAKMGTWQYDPNTNQFTASPEAYSIFEIKISKRLSVEDAIGFYDEKGKGMLLDFLNKAKKGESEPIDVVLVAKTSLGIKKWVRLCAWTIQNENGLPHVIGLVYDITAFKQTEELLKGSEEKFSSAFHNNPDLMILLRKEDWIIIDINSKIYPMLSYTSEELLGRSATDFAFFVNQADREYFFRQFEETGHIEMETELLRKDGSHIQAMLSFSALEFGGKPNIIAVIKDISARKIAEEKFTKAFDLNPDLMLIFRERDLTLIECNKNVEQVSGYKREEIIGRSSMDFELWANPEDRAIHNQKYFDEDNAAFMESIFIRKDKTTFQGNISSKRISLQGESHMLVIVRDITERKIAEQKIIESEANLYAVINNTNMIVWSVDLNYAIIKANRPFEQFMLDHYKVKVVQGLRLTPADTKIDDELKAIWIPRYERVLNGEKYRIIEKHGERFVDFSLGPIHNGDQIIGIVVFAEDITERVNKEQELKNALNKVVEYKLMALRSVMNPHFFFNALNSIQYFIAQNDRENAITYLSTFSRLVRGILEHSVNNTISLNKEIEQLKNYIILEQLRFDQKFEYEFIIDKRLDLEQTLMPSLLVQPYVENAILHGLYNKVGNGVLKISIKKEHNAILFEVTDNGVGREAAKKIRDKSLPGHKSMGTAITEERMSLINNQYSVSLEVIDLFNENHEPAGTCVKIWLKR